MELIVKMLLSLLALTLKLLKMKFHSFSTNSRSCGSKLLIWTRKSIRMISLILVAILILVWTQMTAIWRTISTISRNSSIWKKYRKTASK